MLAYTTADGLIRANLRQTKCRPCAAKIAPRRSTQEDLTQPEREMPLTEFLKLLDVLAGT